LAGETLRCAFRRELGAPPSLDHRRVQQELRNGDDG